jgi:hypothetical protein
VVHADAEQSQAAFAAQGIVGSQWHRPGRREAPQEEPGQDPAEVVERPDLVGEEAVEAGPVAEADLAGRENTLGNETAATGQGPAGEDRDEETKGGSGEDGAKGL